MSRSHLRAVGSREHVIQAQSISEYFTSGRAVPEHATEVITIDGNSCRTTDSFHTTIAKRMKFPDYYGGNLSALEDCFFDIRLKKDAPLILAITHSAALLSEETQDYKEGLLDTFENIGIEWGETMFEPVKRSPQVFVCLLL